jgi:hypothetical protein
MWGICGGGIGRFVMKLRGWWGGDDERRIVGDELFLK